MKNHTVNIIDIYNQGCKPGQIQLLLKVLKAHVDQHQANSAEVVLDSATIAPFDFSIESLYFAEGVNIWCATFQSDQQQRLRVVVGFKKE